MRALGVLAAGAVLWGLAGCREERAAPAWMPPLLTNADIELYLRAEKIFFACTLPFLSGKACDKFDEAAREGLFDAFIGTDAVFRGPEFVAQHPWYHEVSVAPLFARVIHNINVKHSVSALLA